MLFTEGLYREQSHRTHSRWNCPRDEPSRGGTCRRGLGPGHTDCRRALACCPLTRVLSASGLASQAYKFGRAAWRRCGAPARGCASRRRRTATAGSSAYRCHNRGAEQKDLNLRHARVSRVLPRPSCQRARRRTHSLPEGLDSRHTPTNRGQRSLPPTTRRRRQAEFPTSESQLESLR
jgi:hypothetical protein